MAGASVAGILGMLLALFFALIVALVLGFAAYALSQPDALAGFTRIPVAVHAKCDIAADRVGTRIFFERSKLRPLQRGCRSHACFAAIWRTLGPALA